MNATRVFLWIVGALLIVTALVLLFFETGLATWVPTGIALAGLLLVIGLFVMGLSDKTEESGPGRGEGAADAKVVHVDSSSKGD